MMISKNLTNRSGFIESVSSLLCTDILPRNAFPKSAESLLFHPATGPLIWETTTRKQIGVPSIQARGID